jgi:Fe-S-cluster containining protein
MRVDKEARQPGRKLLPIYGQIDEFTDQMRRQVNVTCEVGCSHCCKQLIYITMPEAILLAEAVLANPAGVSEFVSRCYETLKHYDTMNAAAFYEKQTPCVFLQDDRCSAYEQRPVACRTHFVGTPKENCALGAADPIVGRYDLNIVMVDAWNEGNRGWKQRGMKPLLAPLPIAVMWAMRLLTEGEIAFKKAIDAPDLGILDIQRWTLDIMRTMAAARSQNESANGNTPASVDEVGAGGESAG